MPKPTSPQNVDPTDDVESLDDSFYEVPAELDAEPARGDDDDADDGSPRSPPPRAGALKLAIGAAIVLVIAAGLLAYRAHHRRKVLAAGLDRASALVRLDTAAGYREAASLLEPLAPLDPLRAGSLRALALAMLFADYREAGAQAEADALLVAPGRAEVVPADAHLAAAALAIGQREAGNAMTAAGRAGDLPLAHALQARVALLAGNVDAAVEPAAAAAADGTLPAGLALHGDLLRRVQRNGAGARASYEAALAASPLHPRAAYGLAKLALSGQAPAAEAEEALQRVLESGDATPAPERGRAAVHLAALHLRAGEDSAARLALEAAGLDTPARAWAARAAAVEAANRSHYRAVAGAPIVLVSPSDDDPPELSSAPPAPPPEVKPAPAPPPAKAAVKAKPASKKVAAKKVTAKKPVAKTPAAKKAAAKKAAAKKKPVAKKATATRTRR